MDFLCCDNPERAYALVRMGDGLGGLKAVCRIRKLNQEGGICLLLNLLVIRYFCVGFSSDRNIKASLQREM